MFGVEPWPLHPTMVLFGCIGLRSFSERRVTGVDSHPPPPNLQAFASAFDPTWSSGLVTIAAQTLAPSNMSRLGPPGVFAGTEGTVCVARNTRLKNLGFDMWCWACVAMGPNVGSTEVEAAMFGSGLVWQWARKSPGCDGILCHCGLTNRGYDIWRRACFGKGPTKLGCDIWCWPRLATAWANLAQGGSNGKYSTGRQHRQIYNRTAAGAYKPQDGSMDKKSTGRQHGQEKP